MEKPKVYFTDLRAHGMNLLDKLEKLIRLAGIETIDFNNKFTAIKIHFGEAGNLGFIRPNYVARVVKMVNGFGGIPFLTDSNTLYSGRRSNAPSHIELAMENGFNPMCVGCSVIIADGLKGTDYREVEIDAPNCKTAKIGAAIADADIVISMNHFKGHEMTGFGGALKNLGMGSGSRGGKLEMHSASKPEILTSNCIGCGKCARSCAHGAVKLNGNKKAAIDYSKCVGCGQCVALCRFGAANVVWNQSASTANEKIAEYAYAVVKDKPNFHISFLMDISPDCDCWGQNDMQLVPNIGMAASFDPVALDRLCADIVNKAPMIKGSLLGDMGYVEGEDKFSYIHPNTNWRFSLEHAEKIGLGMQDYEMIVVK